MTAPLLTVTETAHILGIDPQTVRRLIAASDLPASNVGGTKTHGARWRVRPADLDRFIAARQQV